MYWHIHSAKTLKPRVYVFSAFLIFLGVFSLHGSLFGNTLFFTPEPEEDVVEAESLAVEPVFVVPDSLISVALHNPRKMQHLPPEQIDAETLWLARIIYSETKRLEEQELVAWVVRNRVDTAYRGKATYEAVALDPYQFSAFNPNNRKRHYYGQLDVAMTDPGWQEAMFLAYYVRHAPASLRPFPEKTRHFYSERSMVGRDQPDWVTDQDPVIPSRSHAVDAQRFRFYAGVI